MRLNLKIWRQAGPNAAGRLVDYPADGVSPDMSFLEMLDVVNEGLVKKGEDAIAFDSDCREGICGMCSLVVNGIPHGPDRGTTVCQLHMPRRPVLLAAAAAAYFCWRAVSPIAPKSCARSSSPRKTSQLSIRYFIS